MGHCHIPCDDIAQGRFKHEALPRLGDHARVRLAPLRHRTRAAFDAGQNVPMAGPVEVDETYMGGRETNKHKSKKLNAGRGTVGKTAIVGVKDRKSNRVSARVVQHTDSQTFIPFIEEHAAYGAVVFTDDARPYKQLPSDFNAYHHESVKHSVGEYVKGQAHTNGIESFWATLKQAHKGVFHKISPKHVDRYLDELSGRHNARELDTIDQMGLMTRSLQHERLKYDDLIRDNGLDSTARN